MPDELIDALQEMDVGFGLHVEGHAGNLLDGFRMALGDGERCGAAVENAGELLFGIELQWALGATCFVAATFLVDTPTAIGARFLIATFLGVVSSFSFADGLLVWPIGFIQSLHR